jgi:hypothetical protein
MDPLSSVKEFREQQGSRSRVVRITPPPILPITTPGVTGNGVEHDDRDDGDELERGSLPASGDHGDTVASDGGAADERRGIVRGRKRVVQVYLPAPTRTLLDQARQVHGTLGNAAMAALRGSYQWLVDTYTPEPVEAVGPFPAPRPTRRRLAVEDPRMRQLLVDPAEAAGIETLADQLEMSLSELVTVAIDHHFGQRPSSAKGRAGRGGGDQGQADGAPKR